MSVKTTLLGTAGLSSLFALTGAVMLFSGSAVPVWLAAVAALAALAVLAVALGAVIGPLSRLSELLPKAEAGTFSAKDASGFSGEFAVLAKGLHDLSACIADSAKLVAEKEAAVLTVQNAGREAIAQAQEASRLAEKSRAEYLLGAATRLEQVVQRVLRSAGDLSAQMERISEGADVQKQRMVETATAMGEMNMAIADISRSSSDASVSVENAKEQAGHSAGIVSEAITAIGKVNEAATTLKGNMASLGEQARSIDRIINVINDIADQTNLLALNAAIEAARAGDAGRGFAVVADEVRKLAEKTMQATKEVGDSISAIQSAIHTNVEQMDMAVTRTDAAADMARKAGDSAQEILRFAEDNTSKIHSIATASEEQSASSAHISRAIEETEKVATSISHGIDDSAKAVLELSDLSKELSVLVSDLKSGMSADTLMPWNSTLATGVKIVDQQHKVLVDMINGLYAAMKAGQGQDVLEKLLDGLAAYTVQHFDMEEKYFDQFKYAETATHKQAHTTLKKQVMDFIGQYKSGKAGVSMDIMNFLRDWLVNHIQKTDMRYVKTFLANGLERT